MHRQRSSSSRRRGLLPSTVLGLAAVVAWTAGALRADNVKLDGGGSLTGSVMTGSKIVTVRTATSGLIVFDRADVKQVTHGHTAAAKTASNTAGAKTPPKKRKLTAEEEAWMPKVRTLVSRLFGSDREKSRQAHNSLLNIDDVDAIPALSTYLGSSRNEQARHLYVVILHNLKGPKPVYYLVAMSLFDESPQIRSEARKAIREDQLDSARLLYIAALRSGPPKLARIAAIGLGEIGDPRGDSIPYLINALVSYGTIATMTEPAQYGVLYTNTIYATPGLKLNDPSLIYTGQTGGTSTMPVYMGAAGMSNTQISQALGGVRNFGQPAAAPVGGVNSTVGGTINYPGGFGGQAMNDLSGNKGVKPQLQGGSGTYLITPTTADTYQQPVIGQVAPAYDKKIRGKADHPEVLDALLKITDQKYPGHGFNQDRWRSWWANEKTNRDLKNRAPDRPISADGTSH
jgi:hypothetical protein